MTTHRCRIGESLSLPAGTVTIVEAETSDGRIVITVEPAEPQPASDDSDAGLPPQIRHDIRNHLQAVVIGVNLLRDELTAGDADDAAETFEMIKEHLAILTGHPAIVRA